MYVHGKFIGLMCVALWLTACQTPQSIQQLQQQNQQLSVELKAAQQSISELSQSEAQLQSEVAELHRVMGVLGTEKSSRVQESSQLRGLMRNFAQDQIDLLKELLVKGDLLDYVGGEQVARQQTADTQGEKNLLLVDVQNAIPTEGILTGVGAYFTMPGNFKVKVLRPIDGNLVVVWESKLLAVVAAGKQRINFPVSVGVEQGDLLGYYFPDQVIAHVDMGTGDSRTYSGDLALGKTLALRSLDNAKQKRAYSLGVYGLLK
ncbi:hypothetical protein R50072_12360 [Simiduia litorea]|uniref:hypothetical protein n=1 Tax=Simiduia litorea TaxID=1435348 RepID=UPI0036F433E3